VYGTFTFPRPHTCPRSCPHPQLLKRVLVDADEVFETLLFKEGDILGVLVDCSTDQPVLHGLKGSSYGAGGKGVGGGGK